MNERENTLRAARFDGPERIPMRFAMSGACWEHYPHDALQDLLASHTLLFPDFKACDNVEINYGPQERAGERYTDAWGCVWETAMNGIVGAVVEHPLADWGALSDYAVPHPDDITDWGRVRRVFADAKAAGRFAPGSLPHGHTFLRLCDLRGYENTILDMMDEDPRLLTLIEMIEEHNRIIIERHLGIDGVEWMGYPEDLGMQVGPMVSPDMFRKHIKPVYERLMAPAREAGFVIHMHSDGDLHSLLDDLLGSGVTVMNLQDLVNGVDWIREKLAGRVCIDLDIDRQQITRFGTPEEIDALIREEVEKLGSRRGGLMMIYGWYPGIPLENVKAVMDAMERYSGYYS
jgi:uroporphyrinogen decarboxylase